MSFETLTWLYAAACVLVPVLLQMFGRVSLWAGVALVSALPLLVAVSYLFEPNEMEECIAYHEANGGYHDQCDFAWFDDAAKSVAVLIAIGYLVIIACATALSSWLLWRRTRAL